MVSLISAFERDGAVVNGEFGIAPMAINDYFSKEGYQVDMTTSTDAADINKVGENSDVVIATVYNNKANILEEVHTVCITKTDDGKFVAHNTYNKNGSIYKPTNEKATLEEAIQCIGSDPAVISVIGIKKQMIGNFPDNKINWG